MTGGGRTCGQRLPHGPMLLVRHDMKVGFVIPETKNPYSDELDQNIRDERASSLLFSFLSATAAVSGERERERELFCMCTANRLRLCNA